MNVDITKPMPLAGTHQPILAGYLAHCPHPPGVTDLFKRDFLTADAVLDVCGGYRPRLDRLARDVANYAKSPCLSQQARRRVPEVAAWLEAVAEATPHPTH